MGQDSFLKTVVMSEQDPDSVSDSNYYICDIVAEAAVLIVCDRYCFLCYFSGKEESKHG